MFEKKTEEEKNEQKLKDTIIQNEQFKNFELYKKYVEPLYSKTFELVKIFVYYVLLLMAQHYLLLFP